MSKILCQYFVWEAGFRKLFGTESDELPYEKEMFACSRRTCRSSK